jgi:DNA-directed RNA polymerase subunit beta'
LLGLKENVIIGKLIPAGTGMSRYRNIQVKIDPDAIPEYWLARQKELAELAAVDGEQAPVGAVGSITREQAEEMLGGAPAKVPAGAEDESS